MYNYYSDINDVNSDIENNLAVGDYVVLQLPASGSGIPVLPFQITRVEGRSVISMPKIYALPSGTSFTSLIAGSVSSPADSIIPEFSYSRPFTVSFPSLNIRNPNNIFELPKKQGYDNALTIYTLITDPQILKIYPEAPAGTPQKHFQYGVTVLSADAPFGIDRGKVTLAHPPQITIYFRLINDTNMRLKASLNILYVETRVRLPLDPYIAFSLIKPIIGKPTTISDEVRRRLNIARDEVANSRVYRIQLPLAILDSSIQAILNDIYGTIDIYPRMMYDTVDEALQHIATAIEKINNTMIGKGGV